MKHHHLICLVLLLGLGACAEKWEKPGGTPAEFDAMKSACESRASMRFPPLFRQVEMYPAYTDPVQTDCTNYAPTPYGSTTHCMTRGGNFHPPQIALVDDNDGPRNQDIRSCFFENGWAPVNDRPAQ